MLNAEASSKQIRFKQTYKTILFGLRGMNWCFRDCLGKRNSALESF